VVSTDWGRSVRMFIMAGEMGWHTSCTAAPGGWSCFSAARAEGVILFFMRRSQRRHLFFLYPKSFAAISVCAVFVQHSVPSPWRLLSSCEMIAASRSAHDRASVISPISLHIIELDMCSGPSCRTTSCLCWRSKCRIVSFARYGTYVIKVIESLRRRTM
jgi:hypothetical protein